jgi:hypothetical protein
MHIGSAPYGFLPFLVHSTPLYRAHARGRRSRLRRNASTLCLCEWRSDKKGDLHSDWTGLQKSRVSTQQQGCVEKSYLSVCTGHGTGERRPSAPRLSLSVPGHVARMPPSSSGYVCVVTHWPLRRHEILSRYIKSSHRASQLV